MEAAGLLTQRRRIPNHLVAGSQIGGLDVVLLGFILAAASLKRQR
jgi:hypothetical protein